MAGTKGDRWDNISYNASAEDVIGNIDNMVLALGDVYDALESNSIRGYIGTSADKSKETIMATKKALKEINDSILSVKPNKGESQVRAAYRINGKNDTGAAGELGYGGKISNAVSDVLRIVQLTTKGFGAKYIDATGNKQHHGERVSLGSLSTLSGNAGKPLLDAIVKLTAAQIKSSIALGKEYDADIGHNIIGRKNEGKDFRSSPVQRTGWGNYLKGDSKGNNLNASLIKDQLVKQFPGLPISLGKLTNPTDLKPDGTNKNPNKSNRGPRINKNDLDAGTAPIADAVKAASEYVSDNGTSSTDDGTPEWLKRVKEYSDKLKQEGHNAPALTSANNPVQSEPEPVLSDKSISDNGVQGLLPKSRANLITEADIIYDSTFGQYDDHGGFSTPKWAQPNTPIKTKGNQQYGPARIYYPSDFQAALDAHHKTDYTDKIKNEYGWSRFIKGTTLENQDNGAFDAVQAVLNGGPKISTSDKIISGAHKAVDELSKVPWLKAGKAMDAMGKMFLNLAKISDDTFTGASDMFTAMGDMTTNPIGAFTGLASGAGELLGGALSTAPALMGGIAGVFGAVSGSSMGSGGGGGGAGKKKVAGLAGGMLGAIGGAFSAFGGILQLGVAGIQGSMKIFSSILGLVMKIQKMILGSSPVFQAIQNILNLALTMLFLPLATAFSNQLIPAVESILNFTMAVGQKLAALVGTIDEAQLATFTAKMTELADEFSVTTEGLGKEFWDGILNNIIKLAEIIVGKEFQDFITNMLGLIPDLLSLAVSVVKFLSANSELIAEVVRKGLEIIKTLLDEDMLTTIMNGVIHILESVAKFEKENGTNFFDFIVPILQTMSDTLLKISDYLTGAKAVTDYITGGYNNVKDSGGGSFWKGLLKSLSPKSPFEDMRKKLTGNYATGGYIPATNGGQLVTVAEGGEGEYIIPESKMGRTGITINISGPVYGMDDFKSKVKQIMTEVTGASYYR